MKKKGGASAPPPPSDGDPSVLLKEQGGIKGLWEAAINSVIRPPRAEYEQQALGPQEFSLYGRSFRRNDLELVNKRGLTLQCSWYVVTSAEPRPCVIYLHGNSGSRLDAADALHTLLPHGVTVFTFDFSGSGASQGEYVSLGHFEKDDVACVVEHLRASGTVTTVGMWGRSMGAATALLYSHMDPSIAGMLLDSPYSDLEVLCDEVVQASGLRLPKPVLKVGMTMMKKGITKRAGFDIAQCAPIKFVDASFVPALFVHGRDDAFIVPRHSEVLFGKYGSDDKNRILVDGGHNSARPAFLRDSASIFFGQCLQLHLNDLGPAGESGPQGLPFDFGDGGVETHLGGGRGGGGGGDAIMGGGIGGARDAEDDDMAAAIAASLADM